MLFKSYLADRYFSVNYKHESSTCYFTKAGVLQNCVESFLHCWHSHSTKYLTCFIAYNGVIFSTTAGADPGIIWEGGTRPSGQFGGGEG